MPHPVGRANSNHILHPLGNIANGSALRAYEPAVLTLWHTGPERPAAAFDLTEHRVTFGIEAVNQALTHDRWLPEGRRLPRVRLGLVGFPH